MNKFIKFFALGVVMISVLPFLAQAVDEGGAGGGLEGGAGGGGRPATGPIVIVNPFKCPAGSVDNKCTVTAVIKVVLNDIVLPVGAVVATLMIMWAGFLYVTAGGNETQIKKAHDALLWGVIGAAILLGAWVISEAISETIDTIRKP